MMVKKNKMMMSSIFTDNNFEKNNEVLDQEIFEIKNLHRQSFNSNFNDSNIIEMLKTKFSKILIDIIDLKKAIENSQSNVEKDVEKLQVLLKTINNLLKTNIVIARWKLTNIKLALSLREEIYFLVIDFLNNAFHVIDNIKYQSSLGNHQYQDLIANILDEKKFLKNYLAILKSDWAIFFAQEVFRVIKQVFKNEQKTTNLEILNQKKKVFKINEIVSKQNLGIEEPKIPQISLVSIKYQIINFDSQNGIASVKGFLKYQNFDETFLLVVSGFQIIQNNHFQKMQEILKDIKLTYSTINHKQFLFNFIAGQIIGVNAIGIANWLQQFNQKLLNLAIDFNYRISSIDFEEGILVVEVVLIKNNHFLSKKFNVVNFQKGKQLIKFFREKLHEYQANSPFDINFAITSNHFIKAVIELLKENFQERFADQQAISSLLPNLTWQSDTDEDSLIYLQSNDNGLFNVVGTFWLNKFKLIKTNIFFKNIEIKTPIIYQKIAKELAINTSKAFEKEYVEVINEIVLDSYLLKKFQQKWAIFQNEYQYMTLFTSDSNILADSGVNEILLNQNRQILAGNINIVFSVKEIKINQEITIKNCTFEWNRKIMYESIKESHNLQIKLFAEFVSDNNLKLRIKYLLSTGLPNFINFKYSYIWKLNAVKFD